MKIALKVLTVPLFEFQTNADVVDGEANPAEAVKKVGNGVKGVASGAVGAVARGINKTAARVVQATATEDQKVSVEQDGDTLIIQVAE